MRLASAGETIDCRVSNDFSDKKTVGGGTVACQRASTRLSRALPSVTLSVKREREEISSRNLARFHGSCLVGCSGRPQRHIAVARTTLRGPIREMMYARTSSR